MASSFTVYNPTSKTRAFSDLQRNTRLLAPGQHVAGVALDDAMAAAINAQGQMVCGVDGQVNIPRPRPPDKWPTRVPRPPKQGAFINKTKPILPPIKAKEQPQSKLTNLAERKKRIMKPAPQRQLKEPAAVGIEAAVGEVALIVGGADCVWDDLTKAKQLCSEAGVAYKLFITNDMLAVFPEAAFGVTLHPDKLGVWLQRRRDAKLPALTEMWAHRFCKLATHHTDDMGGSVGLFGARVAMVKHFKKIIVCGVPLTPTQNHFVRKQRWVAAEAFRRGWDNHIDKIRPVVRSMGGWTADKVGRPDLKWLTDK